MEKLVYQPDPHTLFSQALAEREAASLNLDAEECAKINKMLGQYNPAQDWRFEVESLEDGLAVIWVVVNGKREGRL